jgi:hypothetical protein
MVHLQMTGMATRQRHWLLWAAALATTLTTIGCSEEAPSLLLEVRSDTLLERLTVRTKKYHPDGRIEFFPDFDAAITTVRGNYIGSDAATPLRLNITVPGAAQYAFHLVGHPQDDSEPRIATVCRNIFEVAFVQDIFLAPLPPNLDEDGDTFPEDATAFCVNAAAYGPCEESCLAPDYQAMEDCNPAADYVDSETRVGCGESPAAAGWNPFVPDSCGDCHDTDCFNGDAPCDDNDGDTFPANVDCDDNDPGVNPEADEICGNGIDENCTVDIEGCDDGDVPCDADGDEYPEKISDRCGTDCNDNDAQINPGALEGAGADVNDPTATPGCDDDVDNNCNGTIDEGCFPDDFDNDGVPYPDDCNDCNPGVRPGATEACGNGRDEDCDGEDAPCDPNDLDGDGHVDISHQGDDCDDSDPQTFLGAPDNCKDDVVQNCSVRRNCSEGDGDDDGYLADEGDCDDTLASIHPWADELCDVDGFDEDCDGVVNEVDDEHRGCVYLSLQAEWSPVEYAQDVDHCGRCRHRCCPGATNCEGHVCINGTCQCEGGAGCSGTPSDTCCAGSGCQDLTSNTSHCGGCGRSCVLGELCQPPNPEADLGVCHCPHEPDGVACNNADGIVCCSGAGCVNTNNDRHHCSACGDDCTAGATPRGNVCANGICYCGTAGTQCAAGQWCTGVSNSAEGSCGCKNLNSDNYHCGRCNNACDTNETCQSGTCRCGASGPECRGAENHYCCPGAGCVNRNNDVNHCGSCNNRCRSGEVCSLGRCLCANRGTSTECNDNDPCTEDVCGADNRCDHPPKDIDNDGYCDTACCPGGTCPSRCSNPEPDCNDNVRTVNPGATEDCATGHDDDCDGSTNEASEAGTLHCTTYYRDQDNDNYGHPTTRRCACGIYGQYDVTNNTDCNDGVATVHPGARENCSTSHDDDCDGSTNEVSEVNTLNCTWYYLDGDNDNYGHATTRRCACGPYLRYDVTNNGDCNDGNANINPSQPEICATSGDDNCNPADDDSPTDCTNYWEDDDDDGFGNPSTLRCRCERPGRDWIQRAGDCDDTDEHTYPGAFERCDGEDDNCLNGLRDDGADHCTGGAAYCCMDTGDSSPKCHECCYNFHCTNPAEPYCRASDKTCGSTP